MACSRFALMVFLGLIIIGSAFAADAPTPSPAHSPSKLPEHSPSKSPEQSPATSPTHSLAVTPTADTPAASSPAVKDNSGSSPSPSPSHNGAVSNAGFVYGSAAAAVLLSALLM